jgi:hypothetical protein
MFNPDYPQDDGSNFLMHTYQQNQMQNSMYWNGSSFGPMMGMPGFNDPSSRRNLNPVNPFQQFGQTVPQQPNPYTQFGTNNNGAIPESMVQPFGTYPPATPAGNQQMGLNSLIDSRRNMNNPIQVSQNNPWATPQQQSPAPQPTQGAYQDPNNAFNPFANNGYNAFDLNQYYMNNGFKVDMATAALYQNNGPTSFDKNNAWDNYYTQYRPLMPPQNINWRPNPQAQGSPFNLQAPQPYAMPQYPVQQYATPQNWNDIADRNWAGNV